jgi:hypothetical protein
MKSVFAVVLMFGCLDAVVAQDPPKPSEKRQDPEAVKLVERFDALLYVPRAEALRDLEFATKLPSGHHLVLRWKQPDQIKSELVVPADAPPDRARQLAYVIPKDQEEAQKHAPRFVDLEIGEVLHQKHKDDDILLVAPNQVKIVARSEATKAVLKEQTLVFDQQGLITQTKIISPTGVESTLAPTYTTWNGKQVYQTLKSS